METTARKIPAFVRTSGVCLLICFGAVTLAAQDEPAAPLDGLRAELQALRPFYITDSPVRLRFALHNASGEPVTIPLQESFSGADGVGLPLQLALGTADAACLRVVYEDERSKDVPPPPTPDDASEGHRQLMLAPHCSVGLEIDLREHYTPIRYPGHYLLEWRPLGGALGVVSVRFRIEPRKDAIMVTDYGKLTFALEYDQAPQNVDSFLELVRDGFYDGKTFHRIIPEFIVQGGCPLGTGLGTRPDGKLIPAEFCDAPFRVGTLAMARKPSNPDSASCQFFVTLSRQEQLDGQYTVIGRARDDETLRTLQHLTAVQTDRNHRPFSPVIIRSINLVDTEEGRVRQLGVGTREREQDSAQPRDTRRNLTPTKRR